VRLKREEGERRKEGRRGRNVESPCSFHFLSQKARTRGTDYREEWCDDSKNRWSKETKNYFTKGRKDK